MGFSITNVTNVSCQQQLVTCSRKSFQPFSPSDNVFTNEKVAFFSYTSSYPCPYIFSHALKYKENQFYYICSQCQIYFNKKLGERSHPNGNNVILEVVYIFAHHLSWNLAFEFFDKSSINLIVLKVVLGSLKEKEHIFIIVDLVALTNSINICFLKLEPCISMFVKCGTMVVVMFTK